MKLIHVIKKVRLLCNLFFALPKQIYYLCILKKYSFRSKIISPLQIDGAKNISIGKRVTINYKTWLASLPHGNEYSYLEIGDGTTIGHFNHIYCTSSIVIGKNVLTADKVYISDNLHGYSDIETPISRQPIIQKEKICIGDGAWLGENVCVIGASVGKNSVVGANSVVTKDIPDYTVAVGIPAYIIKRYNFETKQWQRTNKQGEFV